MTTRRQHPAAALRRPRTYAVLLWDEAPPLAAPSVEATWEARALLERWRRAAEGELDALELGDVA